MKKNYFQCHFNFKHYFKDCFKIKTNQPNFKISQYLAPCYIASLFLFNPAWAQEVPQQEVSQQAAEIITKESVKESVKESTKATAEVVAQTTTQKTVVVDQAFEINAQKINTDGAGAGSGSINSAEKANAQIIKTKEGIFNVTEQTAQQTSKNLKAQPYHSSAQDVVLRDASVLANYAPVGYYENFAIRGLALDLDGGYTQNNVPVSARSMPGLANIEQIEVNKGIAKEQSQASAGQINYRSKRPKNISELQLGLQTSKAGNLEHHIQLDQGKKLENWGYRTNLAYTGLDPYVENTKGKRYQASLAIDVQPTNLLKGQLDLNLSQQKQPTTPGYMLLLDGNDMPSAIPKMPSPFYNLNQAAWRNPMKTNHFDASLQTQYQVTPHLNWQQTLGMQDTRTDDFVAFPYPFYENGQYYLRDYASQNEQRQGQYIDQALQAQFNTGGIEHQLRVGANANLYFTRLNERLDYKRELRNLNNPDQILTTYTKVKTKPALTLKQFEQNLYLSDRLNYEAANGSGNYQLDLGAKWSQIREKYSSSEAGSPAVNFVKSQKKERFLPQIALHYQNPSKSLGLYASHQQSLRMGQLPETESDVNFLPARVLKQNEIGLYYLPKEDLRLQAAIFDLRRSAEYLDDNYVYQQNGTEIRQGLELAVKGRFSTYLNADASFAYLWKATQTGTALASINGKRASNVPRLKANVNLDYGLGALHTALNPYSAELGFNFETGRYIDRQGQFKTPSYFTTDLAFKYQTPSLLTRFTRFTKLTKNNQENSVDTIKVGVKNLFDRRYWKDVSVNYGEPYLHIGAPRTFYVQMNMGFY